jgi:hypothetical protein
MCEWKADVKIAQREIDEMAVDWIDEMKINDVWVSHVARTS